MTLTTYKEGSGCESSVLPQTLYKKNCYISWPESLVAAQPED